jgi:glutathione reductase (NADPH)
VTKEANGSVTAHFESGGSANADLLLWAVGRVPNVDSIGLDVAGIKISPDNRFVVTDEYQNTSASGVYSVGDVQGRVLLTPVAIAAGRRLSNRLFGGGQFAEDKLDYSLVPSVIFSHPPIGTVGLSEPQARAKHSDVKIYKTSFAPMHYSLGPHKVQTMMKIVCVGKEERVVGIHIIGKDSDEMIQGFAVAVKMGARVRKFFFFFLFFF